MTVIASQPKRTRKPTNRSLGGRLLQEARTLDIGVSRSAESGIAEAVRLKKQLLWQRENAAAVASSNAYVEASGLPLSRYRQF